MPFVVAVYMVGAFSMSGVPFFTGYISKSMITSAAAGSGLPAAELLLYLASIGTFLYTALRLPYLMFFGENKNLTPVKLPLNMVAAMGAGALLCLLYGLVPTLLYQDLPFAATYEPFTWGHFTSTAQLLIAAFAAFWILKPRLGGTATISLDTDWFYRKPLNALIRAVVRVVTSTQAFVGISGYGLIRAITPFFTDPTHACHLDEKATAGMYCPAYSKDHYRFPVGVIVCAVLVMFAVLFGYALYAAQGA